MPGPRVVAAGRALTVTGGHGHNVAFARQVDGADAVRKAVREEILAGAAAIKVVATGGVLTPGIGATFTAFTPEELDAAVDEAHKWNRGVAAHAIGAEGVTAVGDRRGRFRGALRAAHDGIGAPHGRTRHLPRAHPVCGVRHDREPRGHRRPMPWRRSAR